MELVCYRKNERLCIGLHNGERRNKDFLVLWKSLQQIDIARFTPMIGDIMPNISIR
jgi:hypothetical protein